MWDQVEHILNESTVRILGRMASLLPGMLALAVVVLFSAMSAWLIALALRRFLHSVQFDKQLESWGFIGLADVSPEHSPTLLVTRLVAWAIVLVGFVLGLGAFDATLTSQLALRLLDYLPNVAAALVVIVACSIIVRYLARYVLIESVNMNLQY